LDTAILNAAEWCCRKFQILTGRTNVWLAFQLTNLSIVLYFVWAGVYFWKSELWLRVSVGIFCSALLYALTQTVFKVSLEESEANAYRRVAKGLRNPRRLRDIQLRMSFLTLSVFMMYPVVFVYLTLRLHLILLSYFLIVLTTTLLYLLACDPLPPCAGKVRDWVASLQSAPSTAAEEKTTTSMSDHQQHG
jgi:hypothetical protein